MQPNSFTPHLFHLRRTVNAAVKVLHDCSIAERKQRLEAHRLANVSGADTSSLAMARGRTFALRWRAQETIIRAGIAFITLSVEIDMSSMTTAQKLDLLGTRHRSWSLPEFVEFGCLVGDGWEVAPLDCYGAEDLRMGPLKACGLVMLDADFLAQHVALQPAVEAIERTDAERQRVAGAIKRGSMLVDGPQTIQ